MSYEIIKSIKIENDKVIIACSSNNVYPKYYTPFESKILSDILKNEGREALDTTILGEYISGNFQGGSNKYTRALEILRHNPDFKKFNWREDWDNYEKAKENHKEEYENLLKSAFFTRLPKDKYIIAKDYSGEKVYFYQRKGAGICRWFRELSRAKIFRYKEEAETVKKWFTGSDSWIVEKI